jgi:hypothetical protein
MEAQIRHLNVAEPPCCWVMCSRSLERVRKRRSWHVSMGQG